MRDSTQNPNDRIKNPALEKKLRKKLNGLHAEILETLTDAELDAMTTLYCSIAERILLSANSVSLDCADGAKEAKEFFERAFILAKLAANQGNVSKTANSIGLERGHLHRKMRQYGIARQYDIVADEEQQEDRDQEKKGA